MLYINLRFTLSPRQSSVANLKRNNIISFQVIHGWAESFSMYYLGIFPNFSVLYDVGLLWERFGQQDRWIRLLIFKGLKRPNESLTRMLPLNALLMCGVSIESLGITGRYLNLQQWLARNNYKLGWMHQYRFAQRVFGWFKNVHTRFSRKRFIMHKKVETI